MIMDDNTITALAREYAEEIVQDTDSYPELPICLLNEMRKEVAEDFEEKIRFLLRRFCLVEKSKVKAEYQQAKALFDEALKENALYVLTPMATKLQVLNLMYPEIAKEVKE